MAIIAPTKFAIRSPNIIVQLKAMSSYEPRNAFRPTAMYNARGHNAALYYPNARQTVNQRLQQPKLHYNHGTQIIFACYLAA